MSPRILIVGGVAGGMSAATRARRLDEGAIINVIERGGHVGAATCGLAYRLAGRIPLKEQLVLITPERLWERFRITARVRHEVTRIDRQAKQVEGVDHSTGRRFSAPYDKLILATGARPVVPAVPGAACPNVFTLRSVEDAAAIDDWIAGQKPSRAAVIGGGFIGLQVAEALHDRGLSVTLVEKAEHPAPALDPEMAAPLAQELARNGIELHCGSGLKSLHERHGLAWRVETESGKLIDADMVVVTVGARPDVALARAAGLRLGQSGGVLVDQFQRTSDPDIYAVGDVSQCVYGLTNGAGRASFVGPAVRQGRTAGTHAVGGPARPAGKVWGTAIVKVFGLSVATTGLGEGPARELGFDPDGALIQAPHHAPYFPGAQPMRIKLVYDRPSGAVLGAQVVGGPGVDKRVDVIATAMYFGATVDDLAALDLAYSPEFAPPKDPVHVAAMVAQNQRDGVMPAVAPAALDGEFLVDVRCAAEFRRGTLEDSVNIPLDSLRQNLSALDRDRPVVTMCNAGQQGYAAQRILLRHGFKHVRNLKGGFAFARDAAARKVVVRED